MQRKIVLSWLALPLVMLVASCSSDTPATPTTPTGVPGNSPDGSTLKVSKPAALSPSGGATVEGGRPTLAFQRSSGLFTPVSGEQYRVELYNESQALVAQWVTGDTSVASPQLAFEQSYSWRVRATLNGELGPWSDVALFVVPRPPILQGCEPRSPFDPRLDCVFAVAASPAHGAAAWSQCTGGSGVACHRFVREVARELAKGDSNWGLLGKPPGTWQCTLGACGPISGGYGEDILSYCERPSCGSPGPDGRSDLFNIDIIIAAGIPGASISWSPIPRAFNRGSDFWSPVP